MQLGSHGLGWPRAASAPPGHHCLVRRVPGQEPLLQTVPFPGLLPRLPTRLSDSQAPFSLPVRAEWPFPRAWKPWKGLLGGPTASSLKRPCTFSYKWGNKSDLWLPGARASPHQQASTTLSWWFSQQLLSLGKMIEKVSTFPVCSKQPGAEPINYLARTEKLVFNFIGKKLLFFFFWRSH